MNKNKRVIVRITEVQFRKLTDQVIKEEKTMSEYMRKLLLRDLDSQNGFHF